MEERTGEEAKESGTSQRTCLTCNTSVRVSSSELARRRRIVSLVWRNSSHGTSGAGEPNCFDARTRALASVRPSPIATSGALPALLPSSSSQPKASLMSLISGTRTIRTTQTRLTSSELLLLLLLVLMLTGSSNILFVAMQVSICVLHSTLVWAGRHLAQVTIACPARTRPFKSAHRMRSHKRRGLTTSHSLPLLLVNSQLSFQNFCLVLAWV